MANSCWAWKSVAQDDLFARAFHTCTAVKGKLYIYGGLKSADSKQPPFGDVVTFDPEKRVAERVVTDNGHCRSHHATVLLGERWLCVSGGWDGGKRVSSVVSFDTERGQWDRWSEAPSNDPPVGLSSHTCTKISDYELRIVGREGGLRTQRRYANVYTLRVNANTKTYWYREEASRTASRAGHSAMLLQERGKDGRSTGHKLLVFGGRESSEPDIAGRWSKEKIHVETVHAPKLIEQLSHLIGSEVASQSAPKSLRHQSCTVIGPFAVVFGGETLARGRDTVCNDLYIHDNRGPTATWFRIPSADSSQKRVGHQTCLMNDELYLVGGFGADGKTPRAEISILDISL
ncbi:kelch domain-containing protein 9 [Microcaecilia unicolor]|uniref:Kelch domain-containing protein 9 n=1 Tax=Microcaecilia unicolor TaxID=1415580 RepID=A0A6P7WQ88_9AMPH|nr:kelch domain-containing protein 9 [Microcaecilia unicolor]XP_030043282.1 kelch domain-containing protein 9 [Microcaecilia unicolor]XP_030043283.1 kelch domain-containing protein 9 [Microcaecilia unicolor]